jgi:hypothetical protein
MRRRASTGVHSFAFAPAIGNWRILPGLSSTNTCQIRDCNSKAVRPFRSSSATNAPLMRFPLHFFKTASILVLL